MALADVAYLLLRPLSGFEVVAFLDMRLVLQMISAVRLESSLLPGDRIVELLCLEIEQVHGFVLWVEGGQRVQRNLAINNCGTLRPQLVPDTFDFVSSPGSSQMGPDEDDADEDETFSSSRGQRPRLHR